MAQGRLSVIQGASLLVSALLGSSVLIIPALAADQSGAYSLLAWLIMIIAMLPVVFTFAALGKRYPHESGTAYYVKQAFGEDAAKAIGWVYLSIAPIGPPVVFIAGASYFGQVFGGLDLPLIYLELAMLALVFLMNLARIETSAKVQSLLSLALISTILFICFKVMSTQPFPREQFTHAGFSLHSLGQSMALMFWCFVGIEAICHVAKQFSNPERDFAKSVLLGVGSAAFVYVLVSYAVVVMHAYGSEQQNLLSITHIAALSSGKWAASLVAAVGFFGCFCAVNLYVISFANMLYSTAEEKGNQHPLRICSANGSPIVATCIVTASIALVLIARDYWNFSFAYLLEYANGLFVVIYLAAALAGVKLLKGAMRYAAGFSALFCGLILLVIGSSGLLCLAVFAAAFFAFKLRKLAWLNNRALPK
ncbi:L-methionine/branched-chain amino acid transporter [Agarivorans sp. 1_MG-2023]|uniref:L-methionine/branched-chain amino acid transporter n=1 Tax=Agarivorans sp. 1_MG-2023 TaxID=3062634 RepID=UPI0026E34B1C|nr:L-methionine/branched-chain amino acid transporter [Agarivorans sp. 1_MG-2023]MDO6763109.1 L-methionine/branched-chain amino acid transporter [Agarivorans sp. 1_MG-2023]